jgi:hypothetical protein
MNRSAHKRRGLPEDISPELLSPRSFFLGCSLLLEAFSSELFSPRNFSLLGVFHFPELLTPRRPSLLGELFRGILLYSEYQERLFKGADIRIG